MSYYNANKNLAGNIKSFLESYGIEVFLAHEDIQPLAEWQDVIIQNLKGCDIFMPLLTRNFKQSEWTDQETGFAISLGKVIIPLQIDIPPYGFLGKYQGFKFNKSDEEKSCKDIIKLIGNIAALKENFKDCLINALSNCGTFKIASEIADLLEGMQPFLPQQIKEIIRISIENSQVYDSFGARQHLRNWIAGYSEHIDNESKQTICGLAKIHEEG